MISLYYIQQYLLCTRINVNVVIESNQSVWLAKMIIGNGCRNNIDNLITRQSQTKGKLKRFGQI